MTQVISDTTLAALATAKTPRAIDEELRAIRKIIATLEALDERTASRVMRYVNDVQLQRELPAPSDYSIPGERLLFDTATAVSMPGPEL